MIDSPALIDSITQAVVKDNPKIAERKGFKNIFKVIRMDDEAIAEKRRF